jgi:hypothetical protein
MYISSSKTTAILSLKQQTNRHLSLKNSKLVVICLSNSKKPPHVSEANNQMLMVSDNHRFVAQKTN